MLHVCSTLPELALKHTLVVSPDKVELVLGAKVL